MTVIHSSLFLIIKRFPECKESIRRLYRESENFQEACEDYQKCADALRYWNKSDSEEAPARRDEYTDFLRDLELEIARILNAPL